MSAKLKISAVSYLNTKPFIYGLQRSGFLKDIELEIDTPAACAEKILSDQTDIALTPVGILPELPQYQIIGNHCIGCEGKVNSVLLLSEVPMREIERVYMDYQSKTSVLLAQILAERHWNICPIWLQSTRGYETQIAGTTAGIVIGDRTFALRDQFAYCYDLGEEWHKFTGLPFVFACWVTRHNLERSIIVDFAKAILWGVEHKAELLRDLQTDLVDTDDLNAYLDSFISYEFDQRKQRALDLFLRSIPLAEQPV